MRFKSRTLTLGPQAEFPGEVFVFVLSSTQGTMLAVNLWSWPFIYTRFFSVTARDIKKQRETLSCSFSWSGLCTSVERETEISDRGEREGAVWTPVTNHLFLSSYCKVVKTSSIQTSLPENGAAVYR